MAEDTAPDSSESSAERGNPDGGTSGAPGGITSERLPAPLRLRGAGFGVVLAGLVLAVTSVPFPYVSAAGFVVGLAIAGGWMFREDTPLLQLCLGAGTLGVVGLTESATGAGLGLGPLELGGLAVVFGTVDILVGTLLGGVGPDSDS